MYWKSKKDGVLYRLGEIVEEYQYSDGWHFALELPTNSHFPFSNVTFLGDFRKVRNTGYRAHRI
jgi:hypothetical protein